MVNKLLKDLCKYHDTGVTMFSNLISRLENEGLTPKLLSEMKRYNGTGVSVFNNLVDKIEDEIKKQQEETREKTAHEMGDWWGMTTERVCEFLDSTDESDPESRK